MSFCENYKCDQYDERYGGNCVSKAYPRNCPDFIGEKPEVEKKELSTEEIQKIAADDTAMLIGSINAMFEAYTKKDNGLNIRQRFIVCRRAVAFQSSHFSYKDADVKLYIKDAAGEMELTCKHQKE
jgi:hypothetical protein